MRFRKGLTVPATRAIQYEWLRISKLSPSRLVRGVINYGILPFKSDFDQNLFWVHRTVENGSLGRLRALEEMEHSAWRGLEKIGYNLVRRFKPRIIVELGTHVGFSALAMGLGLKDNGDDGQLFAVDTWQGDEHAGRYGESVHETFQKRIDELGLRETITPMRMLFDEAREQVPTPIDLLHIDGLHTLEAVTHDFETYGPLVRPGGLVLFHDIRSQWREVGEFWDTLVGRYKTRAVEHSNGLGILQMPQTGRPGAR